MVSGLRLVLTGMLPVLLSVLIVFFVLEKLPCRLNYVLFCKVTLVTIFPLAHNIYTNVHYSLFRVFGTAEGSTEATFVEASKNPMRYLCKAAIELKFEQLCSI